MPNTVSQSEDGNFIFGSIESQAGDGILDTDSPLDFKPSYQTLIDIAKYTLKRPMPSGSTELFGKDSQRIIVHNALFEMDIIIQDADACPFWKSLNIEVESVLFKRNINRFLESLSGEYDLEGDRVAQSIDDALRAYMHEVQYLYYAYKNKLTSIEKKHPGNHEDLDKLRKRVKLRLVQLRDQREAFVLAQLTSINRNDISNRSRIENFIDHYYQQCLPHAADNRSRLIIDVRGIARIQKIEYTKRRGPSAHSNNPKGQYAGNSGVDICLIRNQHGSFDAVLDVSGMSSLALSNSDKVIVDFVKRRAQIENVSNKGEKAEKIQHLEKQLQEKLLMQKQFLEEALRGFTLKKIKGLEDGEPIFLANILLTTPNLIPGQLSREQNNPADKQLQYLNELNGKFVEIEGKRHPLHVACFNLGNNDMWGHHKTGQHHVSTVVGKNNLQSHQSLLNMLILALSSQKGIENLLRFDIKGQIYHYPTLSSFSVSDRKELIRNKWSNVKRIAKLYHSPDFSSYGKAKQMIIRQAYMDFLMYENHWSSSVKYSILYVNLVSEQMDALQGCLTIGCKSNNDRGFVARFAIAMHSCSRKGFESICCLAGPMISTLADNGGQPKVDRKKSSEAAKAIDAIWHHFSTKPLSLPSFSLQITDGALGEKTAFHKKHGNSKRLAKMAGMIQIILENPPKLSSATYAWILAKKKSSGSFIPKLTTIIIELHKLPVTSLTVAINEYIYSSLGRKANHRFFNVGCSFQKKMDALFELVNTLKSENNIAKFCLHDWLARGEGAPYKDVFTDGSLHQKLVGYGVLNETQPLISSEFIRSNL